MLGWKLWAIHDDFRDEKVLTFYKEDEIATIKLTKRYNKRLGAVGTVVEGRTDGETAPAASAPWPATATGDAARER